MAHTLIVVGLFAALMLLGISFPLRAERGTRGRRVARTLTLAAFSFGILLVAQAPLLEALAKWESAHGYGVLRFVPGSGWLRFAIAFLFLDYTLWVWHWLNHKVPFLWRFHLVHHVDRDLDTSTGVRFHFGEMTLSIGFRAAQVAILGGDLALVNAWQSALFACVLFHHSNLRLPARFDAALTWLIVTPRMHGIHHSDVHAETDSNWSSLLTIWDRLHRTLRLDVEQARIAIGVPAYSSESDVTLEKIVALPFREQRDDWRGAR
jgi:sterol desaturase/sphingolipid hydroxylase (fatty acid hydroxylase superfamily)